jgi:hypothetical protein
MNVKTIMDGYFQRGHEVYVLISWIFILIDSRKSSILNMIFTVKHRMEAYIDNNVQSNTSSLPGGNTTWSRNCKWEGPRGHNHCCRVAMLKTEAFHCLPRFGHIVGNYMKSRQLLFSREQCYIGSAGIRIHTTKCIAPSSTQSPW